MLKKWFTRQESAAPASVTPEIMGLRLGGAFELDPLKLRLLEPRLVVEGVTPTQLIQAVGEVKLDESNWLLRFYTDDDGFLQVLMSGGRTENHIADVKLWHFYDTQPVSSEADWQALLQDGISQPTIEFEGHSYHRVWDNAGTSSPPVAMTETTHTESAAEERTDQFTMLYQREIDSDLFEYVLYAGEEKMFEGRADRCFVISTGIDIGAADLNVIG